MKVYAVTRGYDYEGEDIIGVCDTLEGAKALAQADVEEYGAAWHQIHLGTLNEPIAHDGHWWCLDAHATPDQWTEKP